MWELHTGCLWLVNNFKKTIAEHESSHPYHMYQLNVEEKEYQGISVNSKVKQIRNGFLWVHFWISLCHKDIAKQQWTNLRAEAFPVLPGFWWTKRKCEALLILMIARNAPCSFHFMHATLWQKHVYVGKSHNSRLLGQELVANVS